jgi:nitrate reductase gamma subunit
MVIGLFGLLARRLFVDRVRYITSPSDIAMLILLILIGLSGIMMTFVWHTDVTAVTHYFRSVIWPFGGIPELPGDPVLWIHLLLVVALMIVFPISKLLHAPGVFFSPSRNMVDNPREQRHVVDWAKKLEQN